MSKLFRLALFVTLIGVLSSVPTFAEHKTKDVSVGVHTGVGFDPEVVIGGARINVPLFCNVSVRPSAEVGWGEVTTFTALNLEAIYKFPTKRSGWAVYVGAGPGFNFIYKDFAGAKQGNRDFDFDKFDFSGSLNVLTGVEFKNGIFVELKSGAYAGPSTRLLVGYTF